MKFTKMHGCGNDYVYINGFTEKIPQDRKPELVRRISDRHFGIGGDGAIFINPSVAADFEMEMYNADGSRAEMCGNGIRCVAKYVYDKGLTNKTDISVISCGQTKYLQLFLKDGKVDTVRVNMGAPELRPEYIPVLPASGLKNGSENNLLRAGDDNVKDFVRMSRTEDKNVKDFARMSRQEDAENRSAGAIGQEAAGNEAVMNAPITVQGKEYKMTCVSMGNPHAVIFVDDVTNLEIGQIGPRFENHKRFPKRTNTEFVKVLDRHTVQMRVWERGTGETLACGTGCCATAVACILNDLTDDTVTVKLLGGEIEITWDRDANLVYMTGPAVTVFEGEYPVGGSD